jgi:hypothetical protein
MKCQNEKCRNEFHRRYSVEEFDKLQYGSSSGIGCFDCGTPKMIVMKSNRQIQDGFKPGFQRNIRKHCETYSEYKAHLRNMGLIEVGYEDLPEHKDTKTQYWTDEVLKKVYNEHGLKFSDREAEHMKNIHKEA